MVPIPFQTIQVIRRHSQAPEFADTACLTRLIQAVNSLIKQGFLGFAQCGREGLPRPAIFVDVRVVLLLTHHKKGDLLIASGKYKHIKPAIELLTGTQYAVGVTRGSRAQEFTPAVLIENAQREFECMRRFRGQQAIVPAIAGCHHNCQKHNPPEEKYYLLMPRYQGDVFQECEYSIPHLPATRIHLIVRSCLCALQALHAQGVVHGDVKPENIFTTSARIDLGDFGLSTKIATHIGVQGTQEYLAPEFYQVQQLPSDKCDFKYEKIPSHPALDMWALGIVCLECFNAPRPCDPILFPAVCAIRLYRSRQTALEWINEVVQYVPPTWQPLVAGLLHPDPSQRWTATQALAWMAQPLLQEPIHNGHRASCLPATCPPQADSEEGTCKPG